MVSSTSPQPGDNAHASDEAAHMARRLESVLSTLAAGVFEADLDGRIIFANAAACRILQFSEQEMLGRTTVELGIERYDEAGQLLPASVSSFFRAGRDGHGTVHTVLRYVRPGILDMWIESHTAPAHASGGELTGTVVSFIDVTDRFRLEAAERKGRERMNDVLRATTVGILLVDGAGRIEYANVAAAAISGLKPEDVVGQLAADPAWQLTDSTGHIVPFESLPVPTALRERRIVRDFDLGVPTMTGLRWMRVSAHPLDNPDGSLRGAVVTTEDVTEQRLLNDQLLQAQKIEGVGQLAGGIAHDFNNLLTVIAGNADIALAEVGADSVIGSNITEIVDAASRGAALTRQLLMFARKQVVQARTVQLDHLVTSLEKLLHRALGESIRVEQRVDADLWPVRVDPGQMEQVIVNIAINARDAMPSGGTLLIDTHNRVVDAREAAGYPGTEPGEFVTMSMSDTGIGISAETLPHIFEPFFTTKGVGRGSGLGLSICHGVLKQARGFITVESVPGSGTTFRLNLPRTTVAPIDPVGSDVNVPARGLGRILLVEDEDAVRTLLERVLKGYGYDVTGAASGLAALDAHSRAEVPFDLLLTDVVMPEMGGLELARVMQEREPALPVLYMTGYFDVRTLDTLGLSVEERVLLKPFTPMQLVARVQELLSK